MLLLAAVLGLHAEGLPRPCARLTDPFQTFVLCRKLFHYENTILV